MNGNGLAAFGSNLSKRNAVTSLAFWLFSLYKVCKSVNTDLWCQSMSKFLGWTSLILWPSKELNKLWNCVSVKAALCPSKISLTSGIFAKDPLMYSSISPLKRLINTARVNKESRQSFFCLIFVCLSCLTGNKRSSITGRQPVRIKNNQSVEFSVRLNSLMWLQILCLNVEMENCSHQITSSLGYRLV